MSQSTFLSWTLFYFLLLSLLVTLSAGSVHDDIHIRTPVTEPAGFNSGSIRRMNNPEIEPIEDSPYTLAGSDSSHVIGRAPSSQNFGRHPKPVQDSKALSPHPTSEPRILPICAAYKRINDNFGRGVREIIPPLSEQERQTLWRACCKFSVSYCALVSAKFVPQNPVKEGLELAGMLAGLSAGLDLVRLSVEGHGTGNISPQVDPLHPPRNRQGSLEDRAAGQRGL